MCPISVRRSFKIGIECVGFFFQFRLLTFQQMNIVFLSFFHIKQIYQVGFSTPSSVTFASFFPECNLNRRDKSTKIKLCVTTLLVHLL